MKRIIKPIIYMALVTAVMLAASCKKDFLDVNTNNNSPESVDVKFVLPTAQSYLGYTMANQLSLAGGFWAQYWTQGPNASQYTQLDQYVYPSADSDRPWSQLYAGVLMDLSFIYDAAQADSTKKNYGAIARILQAYTFQVIADAWGAAPFSEACQGKNGLISPHYETEEQIYDGILGMVNEGLAMLDDHALHPGSDDLIYNGDLYGWYTFANTLKLKIYLRQSGVRASLAQQGVAEMFAAGEPFLETGYDAYLPYTSQRFQQTPLFATATALSTTSNIFASQTVVEFLNNTSDPRAFDYFAENGNGDINGLEQGEGKLLGPNQSDATWSKPSAQIIGPSGRGMLISAAESYFLQAEAIARGWASGDAQLAYETGIEASWLLWQNAGAASASDFSNYISQSAVAYPAAGSTQDKLTAILTQKWVAMCGNQNFEAWTEWRRTGIPAFAPSQTSSLGAGEFPARLTYPTSELNTNPNVPALKQVNEKVWWDVN